MGILDVTLERILNDHLSGFRTITEFEAGLIPLATELSSLISADRNPHHRSAVEWQVRLPEKYHSPLYPHQQEAVVQALTKIVLSADKQSGYCFMPTSGGKSYVIFTLAALALTDFRVFRLIEIAVPNYFQKHNATIPLWISISLIYAQLASTTSTQNVEILVHDIEILKQLKQEAALVLGRLTNYIQFSSVQSHNDQTKRDQLKYVIVDECHWGNASNEETVQSSLVEHVKKQDGRAFGFTASPYEHPEGKFQRTWSNNKLMGDRDFNYYLDNKIIYPIKLKEVSLQNARVDYNLGDEEIDLVEKSQVVQFMVANILATIPQRGLDGPAICFFSPVIIPDIIKEFQKSDRLNQVLPFIKVLGAPESAFIKTCRNEFGPDILADDVTIELIKKGEIIFLITQQKLLVGFNAPYLRYCFISPTASKIKILQGIGRLMRPCAEVNEKLAVLYLASISGNKMDIGDERSDEAKVKKEPCTTCSKILCDCPCVKCGFPRNTGCSCPTVRYVSTSMTLSEAYDLPHKVFYRDTIGLRDFINETRIDDPNTVYRIPTRHINPERWDEFDIKKALAEQETLRNKCFAIFKNDVLARDKNACVECRRGQGEVSLQIHHVEPFEFSELYRTRGFEGTIAWHSDPRNWKYLISLCKSCHRKRHNGNPDGEA